MPLYTALTAGALVRELAASEDDLIFAGTPTAQGTSTTLIDAALGRYWTANDDEALKGAWVYTIAGTGAPTDVAAGTERNISAFTASSGTVAWTGAADDTTEVTNLYIITRKHRPTEYLRAIQAAQRFQAAGRDPIALAGPVIGREIVIGSAIPNNFDLFTTANVPDSLTLDANSTFTMQTTATHGQRRALRMVTDGSNAGSVRYTVPGHGRFMHGTIHLYVLLRSSAAARTTAMLFMNTGSVNQASVTMAADATWEMLHVTLEPGSATSTSQLRASVEVSSGTAMTVEMVYWYLPEPISWRTSLPIDADRSIVWLGKLKVSGPVGTAAAGEQSYAFSTGLRLANFNILEDSEDTPRRLRLDVDADYRGRVLEYSAYKLHPELTAVTTSYSGEPELILPRARYYLLRNGGAPASEVAEADADARRVEAEMGVHPNVSEYKRVAR